MASIHKLYKKILPHLSSLSQNIFDYGIINDKLCLKNPAEKKRTFEQGSYLFLNIKKSLD